MQTELNNTQTKLLDLCAQTLFGKKDRELYTVSLEKVLEEAKKQTVFPIAYTALKAQDLSNSDYGILFSSIIAKNIRIQQGHFEIHRLFETNNIKYVTLKGVASASYYSEPLIRTMGDIDILVSPSDIEKADSLLESIGYNNLSGTEQNEIHIRYKRKDGLICELHRGVNGVPQNEARCEINKYLDGIFDCAVKYQTQNGCCIIPDSLHHGIILLLHTASHLTGEGIGLRHLCDWAVFVNKFSNDEFLKTFEKPLKSMGLWRFACALTLCCAEYLGCDSKEWAGTADSKLSSGLICDIITGGNFGQKDAGRYNQIKYISNRDNGTVDTKGAMGQLLSSINTKANKKCKFVQKHKLLLPLGWAAVVFSYFALVLRGKRKLDGLKTIENADGRKSIYSKFKLFEKQ